MIPAPPEIPAPSSQGPKSRSPAVSCPAVSCPAVPCPAVPCPAVPCPPGLGVTPDVPPQTRPKANDPGTPTLPPRHKRFRPTTPPRSRSASPHPPPVPSPRRLRFPALAGPLGGAPFHPRLSTRTLRHASSPARACAFPPARWRLFVRAMHVGCRVPSTTPVRHARHHAYLGPLTPQPDGYLSLEQFHECGALPNRFSRAPHSLKVSSRGGVAAGVSGGREDGAAGGTGQGGADWYRSGERACPRGRPSLGIVSSTPPNGSVGDSEDPAPSVGEREIRPFGESYRTVRWAGSRGYEPGSGRGRACMATLELRILRRFAWSCG